MMLAAMLFVEFVGAFQVFLLKEADISAESLGTDIVPNPVIYCFSQDGGEGERDGKNPNIQGAQGSE
jgi:hypothetical protein